MRPNNKNILTSLNSAIGTSSVIPCQSVLYASAQAVSTGTPTGTLKFQVSNDLQSGLATDSSGNLTPVNWSDLSGASVNVSAAGAAVVTRVDICYEWLRAVWTPTGAGVQTIHPVPDVAGSLNSKYFLLQDEASVHKYYVWINVDGTGVNPTIAGRTGVEVDISADDTAATIGAALATAIAALNSTNSFSTSGTTTVTVTNKVAGPFVAMTDGTAATGFTFAVTAGSGSTTVNIQTIGD